MGLKIGEIGKLIVINAAYDMTLNTDLMITFTTPSGAKLTVNKAGGVTAPTEDFVDIATGDIYLGNHYWQYATKLGDFTESGDYTGAGRYIDGTPKDFCGDVFSFVVLPCG